MCINECRGCGGVRLTTKPLDHYMHHSQVILQLLWCYFFSHLLYFEEPAADHHENKICSSLYHPASLHKISFQFISNFLSNVAFEQLDKQTLPKAQPPIANDIKLSKCYSITISIYSTPKGLHSLSPVYQ